MLEKHSQLRETLSPKEDKKSIENDELYESRYEVLSADKINLYGMHRGEAGERVERRRTRKEIKQTTRSQRLRRSLSSGNLNTKSGACFICIVEQILDARVGNII